VDSCESLRWISFRRPYSSACRGTHRYKVYGFLEVVAKTGRVETKSVFFCY
jgi:hypothetical protein